MTSNRRRSDLPLGDAAGVEEQSDSADRRLAGSHFSASSRGDDSRVRSAYLATRSCGRLHSWGGRNVTGATNVALAQPACDAFYYCCW